MALEIRGLREDELEAHAQLVYESYLEYVKDPNEELANPQWWLNGIRKDPHYEPEQTRVLVLDGRIVASVTNYMREMYCGAPHVPAPSAAERGGAQRPPFPLARAATGVGGRLAKVSAIGSVATHPDFRRRGFIRQVLAESRDWMRANQVDFSFLFGNEQIYGSSGWRILTAFETVASVRVPEDDFGLTVRHADFDADVPALQAIYDEFNTPLTGPFVRTRPYWDRRVRGGYFRDRTREFYLLQERGEPVAYFRSSDPGGVQELGWRRGDPDLPSRVIGTILQQWPDRAETHFALYTRELLEALDPFIWASTQSASRERQATITLVERYKGLWSYIGPGRGAFPDITDTPTLLRFLRANEYVFWAGVDSF